MKFVAHLFPQRSTQILITSCEIRSPQVRLSPYRYKQDIRRDNTEIHHALMT